MEQQWAEFGALPSRVGAAEDTTEDPVGLAPLVEFGGLLTALSVAESDWDPWGLKLTD